MQPQKNEFNLKQAIFAMILIFQNLFSSLPNQALLVEAHQPHEKLFLALHSPTPNPVAVFETLYELEGSYEKITRMEMRYRQDYGDLIGDLRGTLNADQYEAAMKILEIVFVDIVIEDGDEAVARKIRSHILSSRKLVEDAIEVLSAGLSGMTPEEKDHFYKIFDPGNSGEIDAKFVSMVLENYKTILEFYDHGMTMKYKSSSWKCIGARQFFTDFNTIFICPHFLEEDNSQRIHRDLVHEITHLALIVLDRPYYGVDPSTYQELTPHGNSTVQLPVVSKLIREISRSDTLFHPDAYAWFAYLLDS